MRVKILCCARTGAFWNRAPCGAPLSWHGTHSLTGDGLFGKVRTRTRKVLIVGTVPPPVGGVTRSVENEIAALRSVGVEVMLLGAGIASVIKALLTRFDFAHVHATQHGKRLLGVLFGKIVARKTIFTVHGLLMNADSPIERMSLRLADGAVLLNDQIETNYKDLFIRYRVATAPLTPIFAEAFAPSDSTERFFEKDADRRYLLLYAYDKDFYNGRDVYGVDFVLENLSRLGDGYRLVLLDPKRRYAEEVAALDDSRVIYIDRPVDFTGLLRRVDVYIRPTAHDGNSVAIQEAVACNVQVLASDVVSRPAAVRTFRYGDFEDFVAKLSATEYGGRLSLQLSSIRELLAFVDEL